MFLFPSQLSWLPTRYSELSPSLSGFLVFLRLLLGDKSAQRCTPSDAFDSTLFLSLSFISISSSPPLTLLIGALALLISRRPAVLYLHRVKAIQFAHTFVTSLKAPRPAEASTTLLSSESQTGTPAFSSAPFRALIAQR